MDFATAASIKQCLALTAGLARQAPGAQRMTAAPRNHFIHVVEKSAYRTGNGTPIA
jgi:hypothetical protein